MLVIVIVIVVITAPISAPRGYSHLLCTPLTCPRCSKEFAWPASYQYHINVVCLPAAEEVNQEGGDLPDEEGKQGEDVGQNEGQEEGKSKGKNQSNGQGEGEGGSEGVGRGGTEKKRRPRRQIDPNKPHYRGVYKTPHNRYKAQLQNDG